MGKIAEGVAQMMARGARSVEIIDWIAKQEAKEQKRELEEWKVAEAFATFWKAYPHKTGKPDALKAFRRSINSFSLERIMVGLQRYVQTRRPDQPWLNPATFLRQERFDDSPAAVMPRNSIDAARQSLLTEIDYEQRTQRVSGQEGLHPPAFRRLG